jgi:hypothetical protein
MSVMNIVHWHMSVMYQVHRYTGADPAGGGCAPGAPPKIGEKK